MEEKAGGELQKKQHLYIDSMVSGKNPLTKTIHSHFNRFYFASEKRFTLCKKTHYASNKLLKFSDIIVQTITKEKRTHFFGSKENADKCLPSR
jgi:hypothetical protein